MFYTLSQKHIKHKNTKANLCKIRFFSGLIFDTKPTTSNNQKMTGTINIQ